MTPLRICAVAMCLIWPGVLPAQDLPASFSVTGVAADDVLNIRREPSSQSEIIGQLGPYTINIEVLALSENGKWGKVGVPEGNGWVAMAFLDPIPPTDPNHVPRPLSCLGTEPFWSVSLYPRGAEYNSPDTGAIPLTVTEEAVAREGFFVRLEEGPSLIHTLIVTREACSDGMSDRSYGFATRMFVEAPDGNQAVSGCCTLDHR